VAAEVSLLEVRDLSVEYLTRGRPARAVDKVSFKLGEGEFLGVVGESGCGKSTMLFAIAGLLRPPAELVGGEVVFRGQDLTKLDEVQLRRLRWRGFSVVMQSAMNALNPVKTVGAQFVDVMRAHGMSSKAEIQDRAVRAMTLVGIDAVHLRSLPHQLSGGMRQRAMIAMALLFSPELVVMDEPTSALDVVAQRSLMHQIKELQQELGFATIFVTHDMSLLTMFSDLLAVMYAGQIVEFGPTQEVFGHPSHPYARGLFDAFPSVYGERKALTGIPGAPPDLSALPEGCNFNPRCPSALPECSRRDPPIIKVGGVDVRCLLFEPTRSGHA
jgi:peptide/nickel transport system ATP-binding protein